MAEGTGRAGQRRQVGGMKRKVCSALLAVIAVASVLEGTSSASSSAATSAALTSSWSAVPGPVVDGFDTSVSCGDSQHCWLASDDDGGGTSISATADGGNTWSQETLPVRLIYLYGISCPTATSCWVEGQDYNSGLVTVEKTTDGGATWVNVSIPSGIQNEATSENSYAYGISCPDATHCRFMSYDWALATDDGGATWTLAHPPGWVSATQSTDSFGDSLSCPDDLYCVTADGWAPGSNGSDAILVSYDGAKTWGPAPTPQLASAGHYIQINAVSCVSWFDCSVVGEISSGGPYQPYFAHTADAWQTVTSPTPPAGATDPRAISCTDYGHCWAEDSSSQGLAVETTSDGGTTWTTEAVPANTGKDFLNSIACAGNGSDATCFAVGGGASGYPTYHPGVALGALLPDVPPAAPNPPPNVRLTVADLYGGSGLVTSTPSGLDCTSSCLGPFAASGPATLHLQAGPNDLVSSVAGCTPTVSLPAASTDCALTVGSSSAVSVTFERLIDVLVQIPANAEPGDVVTSSPAGISCPPTCSAFFSTGTQVTLHAVPGPSSVMTGWGDGPPYPCPTVNASVVSSPPDCTFTITDPTTVTTFYPAFQLFTVGISSSAQPDQQPSSTFDVNLNACEPDASAFSWLVAGQPVAGTGCNIDVHEPPGDYEVLVSATDATGTRTATASRTVQVRPSAQFTWALQALPSDSQPGTPIMVLLDACGSAGVSSYQFTATSGSSQVSRGPLPNCKQALFLEPGDFNITLATLSPGGTFPLSVSEVIHVFPFLAPAVSPGECSVWAFWSTQACFRQGADWFQDVLNGPTRPPDFVSVAFGAEADLEAVPFKASADVVYTISCDGNASVGVDLGIGLSKSLSPGDAGFTIGWGYVGDPRAQAPSMDDVDQFLEHAKGPSFSYTAGPGGTTFLGADGAPISIGVEYFNGPSLSLGISVDQSLGDVPEPTNKPAPPGQCTGVTNNPIFQAVANVVQALNHGYPYVAVTSGSSAVATVGDGQTIYVSSNGFAPGSDVTVVVHSTPVVLGTFMTDDHGNLGAIVTLPKGLPAGRHTLIVSGFAPDGSPRSVSVQLDVAATSSGLPRAGALPATGLDVQGMVMMGGGLIALGTAMTLAGFVGSRRRRRHRRC